MSASWIIIQPLILPIVLRRIKRMVIEFWMSVAHILVFLRSSMKSFYSYLCHLCIVTSRRPHRQPNRVGISTLSLPPGYMGLPLIGETIDFLRKCHNGGFFTERYSKYGSIFRTSFLGMKNIHICDVKHVKTVLLGEHRLVTTHWPLAMQRLLGKGALATSSGQMHHHLRKCTRKVMKMDNLMMYAETMTKYISEELEEWKNKREINVYDSAKLLTMKVACAVLLGPETLSMDKVRQLASEFITYGEGFFQLPFPIPGTKYYKAQKAKQWIATTISDSIKNSVSSPLKSVFALNDEEQLSSENEKLNLATEMLFGAQETTACTITCVMMLLENHPHVLNKLAMEISDNHVFTVHGVDDGNNLPDMDKVLSLGYLNNVIKETLRLYPPIGGGFRKVKLPFQLGNYQIPQNWTITYSIKDMHTGSDMDDVSEFCPERWNKEDTSFNHISDFLPFGAGPRTCVGRDYAILFIKLTIVCLLTEYQWEIKTKNPTFLRVPIVRPAQPLNALFKKRSDQF